MDHISIHETHFHEVFITLIAQLPINPSLKQRAKIANKIIWEILETNNPIAKERDNQKSVTTQTYRPVPIAQIDDKSDSEWISTNIKERQDPTTNKIHSYMLW